MNRLKEQLFSPLELGGGLIVAHFFGLCIEFVKGDTRLEIPRGLWQRCELLVRGHHVFVVITFFLFAFGIDHGAREEAWPMVIQVWDQMLLIEGVDERGIALRDVGIAEVFAHRGGVLALDQGVIVGSAGA